MMKKIASILFLGAILCACGPREIGQGTSSADYADGHDATAAEQMRFPMTGASPTEHMLYQYNRPEVMTSVHNMRDSWLRGKAAISPEDPAYRAIPREKSPFRQ